MQGKSVLAEGAARTEPKMGVYVAGLKRSKAASVQSGGSWGRRPEMSRRTWREGRDHGEFCKSL